MLMGVCVGNELDFRTVRGELVENRSELPAVTVCNFIDIARFGDAYVDGVAAGPEEGGRTEPGREFACRNDPFQPGKYLIPKVCGHGELSL
jgi:hypothetical protein